MGKRFELIRIKNVIGYLNIIQLYGFVFILYLVYNMGLHYLTFMGNLENKKNLMLVRIMNITDLNSKNTMNNLNIFNDIYAISNILRNTTRIKSVSIGDYGMNNNSCE